MVKQIIKLSLLLIIGPLIFTTCEDKEDLNHEQEDIDFSQNNIKIVFISRRIANSAKCNLFIMNGDGSEQEKITDLTVRFEKPALSHSGKIVLFVHYTEDYFYELYSINLDGTNLTLIDRAKRYCGSVDWSIDDTKIVYSKSKNDSTDDKDLILFDIATNKKYTLTTSGNNFSARFSPENKIAFSRQKNSTFNIYSMSINGNNKKLIISNARNPVWSPDGNKIAYQASIENRSSQIFTANSDGSNQKQLTSTYSSRIWPGWPPKGNNDPHWTPDGEKIVYVTWEDGDPEIHIMNSDGSSKLKLTNTEKRDEYPTVTSDGKFILFSSNRNMEMDAEVYVMHIDGKNQSPITNCYREDIFPIEVFE